MESIQTNVQRLSINCVTTCITSKVLGKDMQMYELTGPNNNK